MHGCFEKEKEGLTINQIKMEVLYVLLWFDVSMMDNQLMFPFELSCVSPKSIPSFLNKEGIVL